MDYYKILNLNNEEPNLIIKGIMKMYICKNSEDCIHSICNHIKPHELDGDCDCDCNIHANSTCNLIQEKKVEIKTKPNLEKTNEIMFTLGYEAVEIGKQQYIHREIDHFVDLSATDPRKIILVLHKEFVKMGRNEVKREFQKLLYTD